MSILKYIILEMRPYQWIKNIFIFAALIFTGNLLNFRFLSQAFLAFIIFCGLSGIAYIINDIRDKETDKLHPLKKDRPIARGLIPFKISIISTIVVFVFCLSLSLYLPSRFRITALIYLFLSILYSFYLKKIIILDVFVVSLGYVLRLLAGGYTIEIDSSPWSIIMTFFLAVFISLVKRHAELINLKQASSNHRVTLLGYRKEILDQMMIISATSVVLSYSLFTVFSGKNPYLFMTIPFVLYGIFRYIYLALYLGKGEEPSSLILKDRGLFYCIFLWGIVSILIIYWG